MEDYIQIQWIAANLDEARGILELLLSQRLICCGSIFPSVESWYVWEEEVVTEQEVKVVMKTMGHHFEKIELLIKKNHTYDIPEILVFAIENGNDQYLKWMYDQVMR